MNTIKNQLDDINLEIIYDFFDEDYYSLAKEVCAEIGVQNVYDSTFGGKRCDLKNRFFITRNNSDKFLKLADYINEKCNLDNNLMRLEICNDTDGFWLKQHNDHPERLYSYVIYVDGNGPGTTFVKDDKKINIDWELNKALYFKTNGFQTYEKSNLSHGVDKIKFFGIRSTIIATFTDEKIWKNLNTCYI